MPPSPLLLLWLASSAPGEATESADDALTVGWEAPPGCGTRADLERGIRGWLDDAQLEVSAEVTGVVRPQDGAGWQLDVRVQTPDGVREQQAGAAECSDLLETAALIAATQLEPLATARALPEALQVVGSVPEPDRDDPSPPAPEPLAPEEPTGPLDPIEPPPREPPTVRNFDVGGGVRLDLGGGLGMMGSGAGRLGLAGGLTIAALRIELAGLYETPQSIQLPSSNGSVRSQAVGGQLLLCGVPARGSIEFPLCGGAELAAVEGRAVDVQASAPGWLPWMAIALSANMAWRPRPAFAIWVGAAGSISLVRPRFEVVNGGPVTAGSGAVRGLLGLEWRIR